MSTPEHLFAAVSDRPGAVWLDGGRGGGTIVTWDPVEICTEASDWPQAGRAMTRAGHSIAPFESGVLGYIGYGAGHAVESVPAGPASVEPDVWLARYEGSAWWRDGRWHLSGPRSFRAEVEALLDRPPIPDPEPAAPLIGHTLSAADFEAGVRQIREWIAAGDCYQVNLSRAVFIDGVTDPFEAYRRLRRVSDARMGAYLVLDEATRILSNSPEVLLTVSGDRVFSDPIKGTRPRGRSAEEDQTLREELRHSPKDQAELAMIVDLVRNDLGRIAVPGSVVAKERVMTSHATVHHASWPVSATLLPELDAWHALAAAFPPGSVTGAPKIRATQRIEQLETHARGVYCGAVGYVADGGDADWSVAIRTAVWHDGSVRYHVGGGIVADSDPHDEWLETVHKGRALASAFGLLPPDDRVSIPTEAVESREVATRTRLPLGAG